MANAVFATETRSCSVSHRYPL